MASPLPPDPYLALGVAKDASAAIIKLQYRKLVLKFHPDKVQDESQKQIASDQFHRIQTAWEIVGDEERRKRYDAQVDLAQLRKDVLADRQSGGSRVGPDSRAAREGPLRTTSYARGADRSQETSPTYEERKPGYAPAPSGGDYFDFAPRPTARKDSEYERTSKRASPRESDRERTRSSKDVKETRARQSKEKSRKSDRDMRKDRDRKQAFVVDEDSAESDLGEYERSARHGREDPAELRRAKESYHDQAQRQKEAAQRGFYDADERARKLHSQYDDARSHMEQARSNHPRGEPERREPDRRPSPVRAPSVRDSRVEYIKRDGRTPVMVRRGSGRPASSGRDDDRRPSARENSRRSGDEYDEQPRRPPPLSQSRSSPAEIRLPTEKPRSHSMQIDPSEKEDFPPKIKRADSMPVQHERGPRRPHPVSKGSTLRQTDFVDGVPTPGATPEHNGGTSPNKYRYHEEYADDHEYPTPDGYRTETRQPVGPNALTSKPRYTRSPDRINDREREKSRNTSGRYEGAPSSRPGMPQSRRTSYLYTPGQGVESLARPPLSRENSGINPSRTNSGGLFGEVQPGVPSERDARSPRQSQDRYPPPSGVRVQKDYRPQDFKIQTGYETSRRASDARPAYNRNSSSVYAR
ncbi:hypothetical protein LTR78_005343 [Recurvomyces mirabilis]|uniref:J domain-containing protein n=1 Tax=Recurvomyces mirabilis TaxID=574656 RepID=A0AAE1C1A7_9PEZI|nr:hypothetical protein LTR78_005343 [Recurvomyces mirabilis]KAK5152750.1 hypothetical protein LTS14_008284 [Recurvomyces mirabilis]